MALPAVCGDVVPRLRRTRVTWRLFLLPFLEFEAILSVHVSSIVGGEEERCLVRDVGNGNSVAELGVDGWPCDVIRTNLARVFGISAKGRGRNSRC